MKKYFENPMITVSLFNAENIVTVSGKTTNYDAAKDSIQGVTSDGYLTEASFEQIVGWTD